jgi:hypothetical protein
LRKLAAFVPLHFWKLSLGLANTCGSSVNSAIFALVTVVTGYAYVGQEDTKMIYPSANGPYIYLAQI